MTDAEIAASVIPTYQRLAGRFDALRDRSLFERRWLDGFTGLLPPGGAVLDLGCGMGQPIAAELIDRGFAVTGVDAAPAMIALATARFPEQRWLTADMRGLGLAERFAGIIAWDSFFHLSAADQRAIFPVFAGHAAAGAALLFTSGPEAGTAIGALENAPLFHASLDPEEYRELLAGHGFAVVRHLARDPGCGGRTVWLARLI